MGRVVFTFLVSPAAIGSGAWRRAEGPNSGSNLGHAMLDTG